MKVLGIIPARGGSKGVKEKNIRMIAGQPLIRYAIDACQASQKLTRFIVSTDSEKIKAIALEAGAEVIDRPAEIAGDKSPVVDTALHALAQCEAQGEHFDAIMLIQPTSPVRTGEDLDQAIQLLEDSSGIDGVISVTQVEDTHPARMYSKDARNVLTSLQPEHENGRRQDLPPVYLRNGAIYLVRRQQLEKQRTFMPQRKAGMVMNSEFKVNIDSEQDVLVADVLLRAWKSSRSGL